MWRRAISPVVATVILTSILLTTISVAIFFSTSLIDANRQMMEYEVAKDQLTYAATVLEQVAFGSGGSRYVRFSLTSAGISFPTTNLYLDLKVCGGGMCYRATKDPIPLRAITIKGGPLVTTASRLLYPETGRLESELEKILVGPGEPLVLVYEEFARGSHAHLITRRARVIFNGAFNVTETSANLDCDGDGRLSNLPRCRFNFFTIQVVQLDIERIGGSGTIPLVFSNVGTDVYDLLLIGSNILVVASIKNEAGEVLADDDFRPEAPPANGCIVVVKVARIRVSTG